jgi:hypothetical protein
MKVTEMKRTHLPLTKLLSRIGAMFLTIAILTGGMVSGAAATTDWPGFRGPWGNGYASVPGDRQPAGLPLHWSETNNIKWKTAIPFKGWSTPVVMGGQVWLTTTTEDGHDFYAICVDATTGEIRFNEKLFHCHPIGFPMKSAFFANFDFLHCLISRWKSELTQNPL